MAKSSKPRSGSMGVWPRKRSKKQTARIRNYTTTDEAKPLGFAGYKAGMTHLMVTGQGKNKVNAGQETYTPATIIECPPMKIASVRLYKNNNVIQQINLKTDKELARQQKNNPKKAKGKESLEKLNPEEFDDLRIQVYTTPKTTTIKKTPDLFEMELGGSKEEKLEYIKNNFDKVITINDIFKEGVFVDTHSITTGKGFQGPIRRFGIGMTSHKSEKARRNPGSLGGWKGHAHFMYRVPKAGQTGYHQRTQNNNLILKISDKPEEVNPKGGFLRYGEVKNPYIIIRGSIPGPKKRLITMTSPRKPKKVSYSSESITSISRESQQ